MEYRVEELARAAGVRVDTVRFYQTRGLIPPPERRGRVAIYGSVHLRRVRQVRELNRQGISLEAILRLSQETSGAMPTATPAPGSSATGSEGTGFEPSAPASSVPLPPAPRASSSGSVPQDPGADPEPARQRVATSESPTSRTGSQPGLRAPSRAASARSRAWTQDPARSDGSEFDSTESATRSLLRALEGLADEPTYSEPELAEASGFPRFLLGAMCEFGLLEAREGSQGPRYGEADRSALEAAARLLDAGIPVTALLPLAREHAEHVDRVAEQAIDLFVEHVRRRDDPRAPGPDSVASAFRELLPLATRLVATHFERVLLRRARERLQERDDATGAPRSGIAPPRSTPR